jgi:hypothetical protein
VLGRSSHPRPPSWSALTTRDSSSC